MPRVLFLPKGITCQSEPGETITESAQRNGIRLPLSCRNGVCRLCRASLLKGQVKDKVTGTQYLAEPADNEILLCRVKPEEDCEIAVETVYERGELPLKEVVCQVQSVERLQGHVYRVELLLGAGRLPEFFAGQYLSLCLPESKDDAFFSIASAPGQRTLELHIQADPHLEKASEIIRFLKGASTVKVKLPFGRACLNEAPKQDLIMLAAGTGFAQMKSMIESLLGEHEDATKRTISLYWGVRQAHDMYLRELAEQWDAKYSNFRFRPLISDADDNDCTAHHNQLAEAALADEHDLNDSQVFVSGSPRLVFSALDMFEAAGLNESDFYSDVFEYAERPKP